MKERTLLSRMDVYCSGEIPRPPLKYVDVVNCVRLDHGTLKVDGLCARPIFHTELFLEVRLSPNRAFLVPLYGRQLAHSDNRYHRQHLVDAKEKRPPLAARSHVFHLPIKTFEAVVRCLISTVPAVTVRPVPVTTPQTKLRVIPIADENAAVDALAHVPQEKIKANGELRDVRCQIQRSQRRDNPG